MYSSLSATVDRNTARESRVRHFPSTPWARLRTTTWECSCGSPARESQWSNTAATTPIRSIWAAPALPTLEQNTCSSANRSTRSTAARCAPYTASRVAGSARAQATLTDFGTLNVRSNPATGFGAACATPSASTYGERSTGGRPR